MLEAVKQNGCALKYAASELKSDGELMLEAVKRILVSGALELGVWVQNPDKEPGIFGDPLGLNPYDDDTCLK